MSLSIVLYTRDFAAASREILALGGRITHQFTDVAFVANLPDPGNAAALVQSSPIAPDDLDAVSALAAQAWEAGNQAPAFDAADATQGLSWDAPGMTPPGSFLRPQPVDGEAFDSTGTPTSLYMIGSIGVGIVLVSGPGNLAFTQAEQSLVLQQVQAGLDFLANAEPRADITFVYDIHPITVGVQPGPATSYEAAESPWRNAALQQMGFAAGPAGSMAYANDIIARRKTRWAMVAYFTKYPLYWFAYALSERLVMAYSNDNWGPSNIRSVFAHEFCHVFGAADEYGNCSCAPSGYLGVSNDNCIRCSPNHVACLMDQNTLALCQWSRGQIGWDARLFPPESLPLALVIYKKGTGVVAFNRIVDPAQGIEHLCDDQWDAGWTAVKPFLLGGKAHLLKYRQGNGAVAIDRIAPDGRDSTEIWHDLSFSGATAAEPLPGNPDALLLRYNSRNGAVALDQLAPDGMGMAATWRDRWPAGWLTVEPFVWQENVFVLKYRPDDGALAVAAVDAAGAGVTDVWSGTWTAGWTAVRPFVLDGDVHVFGYNRATGAAAMARLALAPGGLAETWRGNWETGWSTVEPFAIDGKVHLVHNKVMSGKTGISRVEAGASGVAQVWLGPGTRGWTAVEPFTLAA